MRLDQAIAARFPAISRRKARELIAARKVLVNERAVSIASREVSESDRIAIVEDAPSIDVIHKTDDWIAINKAAGMPTQATRDRKERSLEELLRLEYKSIYVVHRLDTPTSGVVLFARSSEAAAKLSALLPEMKKTYLVRTGPPLDRDAVIESPIDGKPARTIAHANGEVVIETGRTHQIRVHLASIGHPVVGDRKYGGASAPRLMLHAWKLEHPLFGTLEAPPPVDLIRSPAHE
jgi:23S rRNA-/tRNA-specific pseudouridylate synthase